MDIVRMTNKGVSCYQRGEYLKALEYTRKAYLGMSGYSVPKDLADDVAYNYALTCYHFGNYSDAIPVYETLDVSHYVGRYELSMSYFHMKNIEQGKKHYFNRYLKNTFDSVTFPDLPLSVLNATEDNTNEDVLILNEQGLGDEIMFSRGILELADKVKSLSVQVYPENLIMFQNNFKRDNLTFFSSRSLSFEFVMSFTRWLPFGSLWINTTAFFDKPILKNSTINLELDKAKIHIGFVLSPNKKSSNSIDRSIDIKMIRKMAKNPIYQFHNISISDEDTEFTNYKSLITNFNDTLGIIENMDLIITADTGVAHLAACSKTPTIVAYRKYIDWRWTNGFYKDTKVIHQDKIPLMKI